MNVDIKCIKCSINLRENGVMNFTRSVRGEHLRSSYPQGELAACYMGIHHAVRHGSDCPTVGDRLQCGRLAGYVHHQNHKLRLLRGSCSVRRSLHDPTPIRYDGKYCLSSSYVIVPGLSCVLTLRE